MKTQNNYSDVSLAESTNHYENFIPEDQLSQRERKGLKIIKGHAGKEAVFTSYLKTNPKMAMKYLNFISKNAWVRYVVYNATHQKFMIAS